jgi:hypothetical protein
MAVSPACGTIDGAAEAEAPVMLRTEMAGPSTGLAPVASRMQHAAAQRASRTSRGIGKVPIEGEQQLVELCIGQQG